jgi:putative endonuclease
VAQSLARQPWWRRWFGNRSERAAARFLRRLGCRILARNYRCPHGELDLIAEQAGCIIFVEVRSTGGRDAERPALSVDAAKQSRLTRLALHYLREHRLLDYPARIDVITVTWPARAREPRIDYYPQAFEAVGRGQMYS